MNKKFPKFYKEFNDGLIKMAHCQILFFELSDAPKIRKLINMNYNRYSSSCKSLGQK
jgi:hypothetical protein